MNAEAVEDIELALLLDGVAKRYGYRLSDWEGARVRSRVNALVEAGGLPSISALQERVLREPTWLDRLMDGLWSRPGRGMFADAAFWRTVRWRLVPVLRTWPSIRAWVAGCGTGEDARSLAVLFEEEGLGSRAVIHATDLADPMLDAARGATASAEELAAWDANYRLSGGLRGLAPYFDADGTRAVLNPALGERIVYSRHVPGIEPSFNDFHLILFRNPFVWTDGRARERVGTLLRDSQVMFGFLCLDEPHTMECLPRGTWVFLDKELAVARRVA